MESPDVKRKLRLIPGYRTLIVNAPAGYLELITGIAFDTDPKAQNQHKYDFVQVFGTEKTELDQLVKMYSGSGKYDCLFWICYPKGSGTIKSNINREAVWEIARGIGMQCVTQVSIDQTWSALRCRPVERIGK
jgi:hypothetical protein